MEPSRPRTAVIAILFIIGITTLLRFSQNLMASAGNVRLVDVVGTAGGGAACGAAIFGLIFLLKKGNKAE